MSAYPTIGFIAPQFSGFYFGGILAGIHTVARAHGLPVIAIQREENDVRPSELAWDQIDGWIVLSHHAAIAEIGRTNAPLVSISTIVPGTNCPVVQPDNRGGMRAVVHHLIKHGHERIAFVGNLAHHEVRARFEGYQAALAEHGIAPDPALVVDCVDNLRKGGQAAAQRLLELDRPYTAVVAATDLNAVGVQETLYAAGRQIPAEVAIVGFDDASAAQYATPPLTTVRQPFDLLGRTAAELLLARIAGQDVPQMTYVPTVLVIRRSCGCATHPIIAAGSPPEAAHESDWKHLLACELVRLARYPLLPNPATPSAHVWPGVEVLIDELESALSGRAAPDGTRLQQAWQAALALTTDLQTLHTMLMLLRQAGEQQLSALDDTDAARTRLTAFLDQAQLELTRVRLANEASETNYLAELAEANYELSLLMLGNDPSAIRRLAWLRQTTLSAGCLALWDHEHDPRTLVISGIYNRAAERRSLLGCRYPARAFPPNEIIPSPASDDGIDVITVFPVRSANRDWGLLVLSGPVNSKHSTLQQYMNMWANQLGAVLERAELLESLAAQQESLREAYERERALADTVRELGCPVIPLMPGVLLVPLVGAIDSSRASQIIEAVLQAVNAHRADTVLLDITGVPLVDTQVANSLLQTARAAMLLGAQVFLVGVRPEIAQSIVGLGVDLRHLITRPTLAAALELLAGQATRYRRAALPRQF